MAVAFTNLPWLLWSGKQKEPRISSGSSLNTSSDTGSWDSDTIKFPFVKRTNVAPSSKRVQRKWHSREERRVDREYDVVLVPSDGGCVSGSESDGSDWSIGWLEPHGAGFQSDDDDIDNSFAVLVPCYGRIHDVVEDSRNKILGTIGNVPDINPDESKKYIEHWLSTLESS